MDTIMQAVNLMESNQSEKAVEVLESYLPIADEEERHTIAELYIQWGFLHEASVILNELLQRYPNESEIKVMLADIYIDMEDDELAINLLNEIPVGDPAYTQTLIQLADLYQAQGLFEVAEQKLLTAKQHDPNEVVIDFALGELLFSIGEYRKAITYYEKILPQMKEVANISINDRLGEAHAASGDYELALTFFQDIESEHPDTLFKYGLTAYQAARNDIAIKAWEHVMEIDPYYHTVYYQLANVYDEEGMPNDAYETAVQGLGIDEFNKELFFLAGVLAHQLNNDDESEKWVREAIVLDHDYKEAILFLIEQFKTKDKYAEIVDLIVEIKELGADDSLYEWELARAYNEIESYDDALKHYKEAYNSLNQDSDFMKDYGYFLTEEGRTEDAIPILEAYLAQQPLDIEIEDFLNRLKQAKDGQE
ncbi:tetratricopeptide (TPR) repeat protein [Virgibacillus natechei]|uniref:Tetratricopeptide (TPR) repeat protein n=1 Tax=Virgibacillus natechei TaxID=1216297 RepID=A0ABS4IFA9_9BACI|nr:tetratricopeptide repeat protein [Virgibacillus natechei]MBP1969603.1 tetratricopeptide (TPR) repeat protein [Virgibacillus natechei]UZD11334.1 tetratricopeptide repeat protein [Virgibacillus natechei]